MFALRRFSGEGIEMNHALGDSYTVIYRETNPLEFSNTFKAHFERNHIANNDPDQDDDSKRVYAFISGQGVSYLQPLYKNQKAYVVTESGKTYSNISYRG